MHSHASPLPGRLAIVGALGCDFAAFLADINLGAIATGITLVSGAVGTGIYLIITQFAKAKAEAHRVWLEANKDDQTRQLAEAQERLKESQGQIEANTQEIAELRETLRRREEFLLAITMKKDAYSQQMDVLSARLLEKEGVILEKSTTKMTLSASGDELPTLPTIDHDRHP